MVAMENWWPLVILHGTLQLTGVNSGKKQV